jgi:hypothetical protein
MKTLRVLVPVRVWRGKHKGSFGNVVRDYPKVQLVWVRFTPSIGPPYEDAIKRGNLAEVRNDRRTLCLP